jgi:hypothetical protein
MGLRSLRSDADGRDEGFVFFCAGIFVVQVSGWRTDSVRVRPWSVRGKSIVIYCTA